MRNLKSEELKQVCGAGITYDCEPEVKNNNGFGNGPESGPAPGNSGDNPAASASDKDNNTGYNGNETQYLR